MDPTAALLTFIAENVRTAPFLAGIVGNLLASAGYDAGKAGLASLTGKLKEVWRSEGHYRNHDLMRALLFAECQAAMRVCELCLLEDYGVEPSFLRAVVLQGDLTTYITNRDARVVAKLRTEYAAWASCVQEISVESLESVLATELEDVSLTISAGREWGSREDLAFQTRTTSNGRGVLQAMTRPDWLTATTEQLQEWFGGDPPNRQVPPALVARFDADWFDLVRAGFREALKSDAFAAARRAFELDVLSYLDTTVPKTLAQIEAKQTEADRKLDRILAALAELHQRVERERADHADRELVDLLSEWREDQQRLPDAVAERVIVRLKAETSGWALPPFPELPGTAPRLLVETTRQADPVSAETHRALEDLRARVRSGVDGFQIDTSTLDAILRHEPRTLEEFHLRRVAEWSQPKNGVLNQRFTTLRMLVDRGPDSHAPRWHEYDPKGGEIDDLRTLLDDELSGAPPAIVVLGPPGSGKSTLLKRMELDLAIDALRAGDGHGRWSLLVSLGSYRPERQGTRDVLPTPREWLATQWANAYRRLPSFDDVWRSGRLDLLLDALNEMPHVDSVEYSARCHAWSDGIADLLRQAAGTRVVLSCRSLNYSERLSIDSVHAVPHARIKEFSDTQIETFLVAYGSERGQAIWSRVRNSGHLDLYRSPYYLRMLLTAAGPDGTPLSNRTALFTAFVRQLLLREIAADHPLFRAGALLAKRERERAIQGAWRDEYHLPSSPLLDALCSLAFELQGRRDTRDSAQVRVMYADALQRLGGSGPDVLLEAAVAIQVLDDDRRTDEVFFVHQLLQEYFAARLVAGMSDRDVSAVAALPATPWRAADFEPPQRERQSRLMPVATGWEETFLLAAPMVQAADVFVAAVADVNLPLAGRCVAQSGVRVSLETRSQIQTALLSRSRNTEADLRARIAAASALAEVGDPRFQLRTGAFGPFLMPPLVHFETASPFAIGMFPVTNREWRLFMSSGGYKDGRWWNTDDAKRWLGGGDGYDGFKKMCREIQQMTQADASYPERLKSDPTLSAAQVEGLLHVWRQTPEEFEEGLSQSVHRFSVTQPRSWGDPLLNQDAQPVVDVSWYEAVAYCAWLTEQSGVAFRLPSEAEWEQAARPVLTRDWTWQDHRTARANVFETGVGCTTPVGVFPAGDSPEGVCDLIGNVYEWTSSAHEKWAPPSILRVLRGGYWGDRLQNIRRVTRSANPPEAAGPGVGFRLSMDRPSPRSWEPTIASAD